LNHFFSFCVWFYLETSICLMQYSFNENKVCNISSQMFRRINHERDFKTNRKLWYLVRYWYFSIYIAMENDILHIGQCKNCIKEKVWSILAPDCDNGVVLILPIKDTDIRPLFFIKSFTSKTLLILVCQH